MSHPSRPYVKPARTMEDLLAHLEARGLTVTDREAAIAALRQIGYYRLLIYMRPLQQLPDKRFSGGTRFEDVLTLYNFDRELRLLCLDAVERIEVALRAAVVNVLSPAHGPHFYLESRHFETHERFREFMQTAASARYGAIQHYTERYNTPSLPPIWAVVEAITYGALSRLYSGLHVANRKRVAKWFGYDEKVLVSWFRSLNALRNMCAHHNRLWNFDMRVDQPMAARAVAGEMTRTNTFYARAVVMAALLDAVEPDARWNRKLVELVARYPGVPVAAMGFPAGWAARPLWLERRETADPAP
jgi:abortive infection bacteriophage resistance protein